MDKVKAKIQSLCPDIALRILLVDKRKPKKCNLTIAAHKAGLRPPRLAGDNQIGLVVGESKDKKSWYVSWFKNAVRQIAAIIRTRAEEIGG